MKEKYKLAEDNNRKLVSMRPLPPETVKSLKDYYRIGLTFSSNALEGNSLTESETKVVIEDGLTIEGKPLHDVYEAVGHAKAYDYIYQISSGRELQEQDILKLHNLFYQQINAEQAGHYRTVPVFISGSRYAVTPPQKIATEMKKFVSWFNKSEAKIHPVEFAALVHKKFVFIHPFIDGNGRLSRLLMNLSLLRNEYSIAIIPAILRNEYIASLELAHKDDSRFKEFIADRIIATQLDLLRLLKSSGGVKTPNGGVNNTTDLQGGGVNTVENEIVELLKGTPGLNAPALASATGKGLRTIQRYLKILSDHDKIRFRGAPKTGGYFLSDKPSSTEISN
jgi:Fic family protein